MTAAALCQWFGRLFAELGLASGADDPGTGEPGPGPGPGSSAD